MGGNAIVGGKKIGIFIERPGRESPYWDNCRATLKD